MHQHNIKRNFLQHHSIPICLRRSIPIGCMMALLLLVSSLFGIDILSIGSIGSLFGLGSSNEKAYALDSPSATTSLSIANKSLSTTVAPGEIGYVSSNVTYSASDIANYTLRVTYANGYDALRLNGTGSTILSGAGTSGVTGSSLADNTWGFAWGNASDTNSSMKYYTVPTYGSTGTAISNGYLAGGSTTSIASTTKKIVFAAKFASTNTNNGHYSTSVLLSLIATPKQVYNYSLSYDANGGTGAPAAQTALTQTATSYSFTISDTKPTRSGYMFLGWNDTPSATTANTNYDAGKTITLQSTASSKVLYAVWREDGPSVTGFGDIRKMQDMTSTTCTNVTVNSAGQLYDARDESTYTIQKLSDGKCWMTQNLKLDISVANSLTPSDSDVSSNWPSTNVETPMETSDGVWASNNNAILFAKHPVKVYSSGGQYNESYGYYYSWCAATAGTCVDSGEAANSICPKGWRLPTESEYDALIKKGASSWTTSSGFNGYWIGAINAMGGAFFQATGYVDSNGLNKASSYGNYWSKTACYDFYSYNLDFGSNDAPSTGSWHPKSGAYGELWYFGFSVRCVAK